MKKKISLKWKIGRYLILFAVVLIALLFLFQIVLLEPMYESSKLSSVKYEGEEIASAIDEGLNRVKFAYKVSKEELDVVEVADKLIDATVARVVTVADKVIERGVPVVLDKLCKVIARVYPPATVFVPVIKAAEKYIVPIAKMAVRKGLSVVVEGAKSFIRSTVKTLKNGVKKFVSWLVN